MSSARKNRFRLSFEIWSRNESAGRRGRGSVLSRRRRGKSSSSAAVASARRGKRQRPANKLQSPGTGEVHHVCQSVLRAASYTHPPQGRPAQAGSLGSLAVWPVNQPAWPSPSALSRAYNYGTVCCQVLQDGWPRPSPDPFGPSETNLPCMSSHPVEAGALLGQELGEVLRTGGACRDVITIAGSACSDRYLVPSVLVSAACCTCRWRILSSASGIIPQGAMKSK